MSTLEYKDFIGISNTKDLKRTPPGYFRSAINVDSDDNKKLFLRRGKEEVDATSTHSLWSNKAICLCVQGGDLREIVINAETHVPTFTTILEGVGDTEMQYQGGVDMVFFSNATIIGYIRDHAAHPFPTITEEFKAKMLGGHLLEFWNMRLWAFHGNILVYSDAGRPMVRDERHNYIQFNGRGRLLKAVSDGLYVSDSERCLFLQGGSGNPPVFKRIDVTQTPCIEGMSISVEGDLISERYDTYGKAVYFATEEGIYRGIFGGQITRVTKEHYRIEGVSRGRALSLIRVQENSKFDQILACYDFNPGYGGIRASLEIPAIETELQI
jgi:hypothetical protein